jgi:hypothetical protein
VTGFELACERVQERWERREERRKAEQKDRQDEKPVNRGERITQLKDKID